MSTKDTTSCCFELISNWAAQRRWDWIRKEKDETREAERNRPNWYARNVHLIEIY